MSRKKISQANSEVDCPLCGSKVVRDRIRVAEANMNFLNKHCADGTLDEALTVLRIICEKVPGIKIDVSNRSALEEYFKKIQEQVARTVVTPIALLVNNANQLMERLSGLTDKVPSGIKNEFIEINKELTEKLENMEKNSMETPLAIFNGTLNPLMEKLGQLVEKLPKDIREEFKEVKTDLQEKINEIRKNAEESNNAVGLEVKELRNSISSLINKPTAQGRVGEGVLAELWRDEFTQDVLEQKGGAGEPDVIVVPYLDMKGGDYGRTISLERKAGVQKYSGKHLEEVSRHARKCGATQAMLVYDSKTNLPEDFRPMKILFRPQQKLTMAIACLDDRSWVTAREVLEVLQIIDPPNDEPQNEINLIELDKAIADMHAINTAINGLRRSNNATIRNCEATRVHIEELEESIFHYQAGLRKVLESGKRCGISDCKQKTPTLICSDEP